MAELVGRTISASSTDPAGGPAPPRAGTGLIHRVSSAASFNSRLGSSTIGSGSDDLGRDPGRLYALLESAMEAMAAAPAADSGAPEASRARERLDRTWDACRRLLDDPSTTARRQAAMHQGQFLTTALHVSCKLADPPADVIRGLIAAAPETVTWTDANGWLPLHHACANGASGRVLAALVAAYPGGKIRQDNRLRTPLHFAFFRKDATHEAGGRGGRGAGGGEGGDDDNEGNSMPEIVRLLADSGAAELQDEGGMLPLHYASAYGTTREVLEALLENYPGSIAKRENKGRNPLHLAMVNAHRRSSPQVVGFLLEQPEKAAILDTYDGDNHLPIHLLAMSSRFPDEKVAERKNATDCLCLYLAAQPKPSADFLTAVQTLPEWLRDIAVISDHIQDILNQKIVMQFPTAVLILDFFALLLSVYFFEITSGETIDHLFMAGQDNQPGPAKMWQVVIMMIIGVYFFLRELIQVISLLALGNISAWVWDVGNWIDLLLIFSLFFFGSVMLMNENALIDPDAFRNGASFTKLVLWLSVISFLKSVRVEFSVFVSGVVYVVNRLKAFLMALLVILLAFAQMFFIVYAESPYCQCTNDNPDADRFPHCTFMESMLKVYTMLMGEIGNEMRYSTSYVALILYYLFTFLVVILLSNVLIAIVTDSYGVIKNERAAMVFWSNRLDFIAEMDAILNVGSWFHKFVRRSDDVAGVPAAVQENPDGSPVASGAAEKPSIAKFRHGWSSILNLFDSQLYDSYDVPPSSFEFWCHFLVRVAVVLVVIPAWLIVGLCTAGVLWPPQIREYLFKQRKVAISRADIAEQVTVQIKELKDELKTLRAEVKSEMKSDRREFSQVKAEVQAVQAEVMADLLQVKEIMVTLLDMSRDHFGTARQRA